MKKEDKNKVKKHRHKWERLYCECPDCGQGEHIICEECGEIKE